MELTFIRGVRLTKYIYEGAGYHSESNYTLNIGLRKLTAFDKEKKPIYTLRQRNWLCRIITWFPLFWILSIGSLPKNKFYRRGTCIGKTKLTYACRRELIIINEDCYEIYLHTDNYISILKNDVQIALIHKAEETYNERNTYAMHLDENLESDISLIALFIAFIDVVYFPNRYQMHGYRKETDFIRRLDKLYHRTSWKPADPEVQKQQGAEHVLGQINT